MSTVEWMWLLWLLYCSTCMILQQMRVMCLYCSTCTVLQQIWLLWLLYCSTRMILQQTRVMCLYCSTSTIVQQTWLLWLLYCSTSADVATEVVVLKYLHDTSADECNVFVLQYLHNTSADVTTVVVVLQYLHKTNRCCSCGCYTAVLAQYLNICVYYCCCTVILHITFTDVAPLVAGTAAVTAVHGKCHKSFRCFALGLWEESVNWLKHCILCMGTIFYLTICFTVQSDRFTEPSHYSAVM